MASRYRVSFTGILAPDAHRILEADDYEWESDDDAVHSVVVEAESPDDAIAHVSGVLSQYGALANYAAQPVD